MASRFFADFEGHSGAMSRETGEKDAAVALPQPASFCRADS